MNNTEIDGKFSDRFSFRVTRSLRNNESPQAMGCVWKSPHWGHPAFAIIVARCVFPRGLSEKNHVRRLSAPSLSSCFLLAADSKKGHWLTGPEALPPLPN